MICLEMETKRPHSLHNCNGPSDFLSAFEAETGMSLDGFIDRLADRESVNVVILAGSIPLGVATSVSDLDLIVLLESPNSRPLPSARTFPEIVFAAEGQVGSMLEARQVVAVLNGVEVDVHFLSAPAVVALAKRIARAGVLLTPNEICFMSRIKTGWVLAQNERFSDIVGRLRCDNSLEIHTATTYVTGSLQELEDAHAALTDNQELALYLGRCSVEKCFTAFLASRGYAYTGGKWLRLIGRLEAPRSLSSDSFRSLLANGVRLLFPAPGGRATTEQYLAEVGSFLRSAREVMELDPLFKVAFAMCPQINEPVRAKK